MSNELLKLLTTESKNWDNRVSGPFFDEKKKAFYMQLTSMDHQLITDIGRLLEIKDDEKIEIAVVTLRIYCYPQDDLKRTSFELSDINIAYTKVIDGKDDKIPYSHKVYFDRTLDSGIKADIDFIKGSTTFSENMFSKINTSNPVSVVENNYEEVFGSEKGLLYRYPVEIKIINFASDFIDITLDGIYGITNGERADALSSILTTTLLTAKVSLKDFINIYTSILYEFYIEDVFTIFGDKYKKGE